MNAQVKSSSQPNPSKCSIFLSSCASKACPQASSVINYESPQYLVSAIAFILLTDRKFTGRVLLIVNKEPTCQRLERWGFKADRGSLLKATWSLSRKRPRLSLPGVRQGRCMGWTRLLHSTGDHLLTWGQYCTTCHTLLLLSSRLLSISRQAPQLLLLQRHAVTIMFHSGPPQVLSSDYTASELWGATYKLNCLIRSLGSCAYSAKWFLMRSVLSPGVV